MLTHCVALLASLVAVSAASTQRPYSTLAQQEKLESDDGGLSNLIPTPPTATPTNGPSGVGLGPADASTMPLPINGPSGAGAGPVRPGDGNDPIPGGHGPGGPTNEFQGIDTSNRDNLMDDDKEDAVDKEEGQRRRSRFVTRSLDAYAPTHRTHHSLLDVNIDGTGIAQVVNKMMGVVRASATAAIRHSGSSDDTGIVSSIVSGVGSVIGAAAGVMAPTNGPAGVGFGPVGPTDGTGPSKNTPTGFGFGPVSPTDGPAPGFPTGVGFGPVSPTDGPAPGFPTGVGFGPMSPRNGPGPGGSSASIAAAALGRLLHRLNTVTSRPTNGPIGVGFGPISPGDGNNPLPGHPLRSPSVSIADIVNSIADTVNASVAAVLKNSASGSPSKVMDTGVVSREVVIGIQGVVDAASAALINSLPEVALLDAQPSPGPVNGHLHKDDLNGHLNSGPNMGPLPAVFGAGPSRSTTLVKSESESQPSPGPRQGPAPFYPLPNLGPKAGPLPGVWGMGPDGVGPVADVIGGIAKSIRGFPFDQVINASAVAIIQSMTLSPPSSPVLVMRSWKR